MIVAGFAKVPAVLSAVVAIKMAGESLLPFNRFQIALYGVLKRAIRIMTGHISASFIRTPATVATTN
jgi:hypothetical protein